MYIKNQSISDFFWIQDFSKNSDIYGFNQVISSNNDSEPWIFLLGKERSLYDYPLSSVYQLHKKIGSETLLVLCQSLTNAQWNGKRYWINTQRNISNFNMNLFCRISRELSDATWRLQEHISWAIHQVLEHNSSWSIVKIAYPFHFVIDDKKVAWHLIQKKNLDDDTAYLRIWIWVNTALKVPELPDNDQLSQWVFHGVHSLNLHEENWIQLSQQFRDTILDSIKQTNPNIHTEYLNHLNLQPKDMVEVYHDDGSIQFDKRIDVWNFVTVDSNWFVELNHRKIESNDIHLIKKK